MWIVGIEDAGMVGWWARTLPGGELVLTQDKRGAKKVGMKEALVWRKDYYTCMESLSKEYRSKVVMEYVKG